MKKISRRNFLKPAVGGAIATSTLGCNILKAKKRPMNVIFIMTDQQPTSTLGCYGNPLNPTPNLDRLAGNVDILPTLIDILGLPEEKGLHGKSFRQALASPNTPFRDRVFIHWNGPSFITLDGQWKYALHPKSATDELYNLGEDPGEMKNLAMDAKFRDILKKKRLEIYSRLHETGYPYAGIIEKDTKNKHMVF